MEEGNKLINDNVITKKDIYMRPILMLSEDPKFKKNHSVLRSYLFYLLNDMDQYISKIEGNNFWEFLPKVLGLDSKLQLLQFYVRIEESIDICDEKIIQIIEKDYFYYNKELLQHGLDSTHLTSLIFFVK